jgi:hypothetical protein
VAGIGWILVVVGVAHLVLSCACFQEYSAEKREEAIGGAAAAPTANPQAPPAPGTTFDTAVDAGTLYRIWFLDIFQQFVISILRSFHAMLGDGHFSLCIFRFFQIFVFIFCYLVVEIRYLHIGATTICLMILYILQNFLKIYLMKKYILI